MSSRKCVWVAFAPVLALAIAGAAAGQSNARLATFDKDGETYFALSVMPGVKADPAQKNEVVILIDTSASQAGSFRTNASAALGGLLKGLKADDRVHLMAVDLNAVEMHEGFVAPTSAGMQAALAKLQARAPLGATDLEAGLRAAAAKFAKDGTARTVFYIGDAMSKANLLGNGTLAQLVGDLRNEKVSVSGYVLGVERNGQLMAALSNHTGGMTLIAANPTNDPAAAGQALDPAAAGQALDPAAAGQALGASARAGVIWPSEVVKSDNIAVAYPSEMPPLRTDRDSILIGTLAKAGETTLHVNGAMNGRTVEVAWQAKPEKSSEDFAFLPRLMEMAKADKGLSLPTVGSAGLKEAGLVTLASAHELTKLAHQALASGNFAGAKQVAAAALARDPKNPEALAIQQAASKGAAGLRPRAVSSEPDLKLTGFTPTEKTTSSLLEELKAEQPGFLSKVEEERQVLAGKIRAEVENALNDARHMMSEKPDIAEQNLKVVLQKIESNPDLDAEVRSQIRQQVENAIRQARRLAGEVDARRQEEQERIAKGKELAALTTSLETYQLRLKQLMDRFDSLIDEGRYQVVEEQVAPEVQRLAPGTPIAASAIYGGQMMRAKQDMDAVLQLRDKNFVQALYQVELSFVPFPDEPPVIYVAADKWEELTRKREKYKAVDLGKQGGAEQRIAKELNSLTELSGFIETPLKDVIGFLRDKHGIPIEMNTKALSDAGANPDAPVTKELKNITLRSALRLLLNDFDLTYVIRDEVLMITSHEDAEGQLITKVYPVGDLVVPIGNFSGMGGLGGGAMGMMGGGMGGGMGGMGGGMGGMGGGMGGMGGGMGGGGGFFAVEDDLKLGAKKPQAVPPAPAVAPQAQVRKPATRAAQPAQRIILDAAAGQSPVDGWESYFAKQQAALESPSASSSAQVKLLASLRETVRQLMHEKKYDEVSIAIQAALRHGLLESWMYEAMALAMQVGGAPPEELERVLMSGVDFADSPERVMVIAAYMANAGLHKRALKLYQEMGNADPSRPEPFIQGLALAQRLEDTAGIEWACVGLLSQAWPNEHRAIGENAYRVGKATYERLLAAGRKAEAEAFDAAVRKATVRDCVVMVTWTGDADIDLSVQEPAGTVVSSRQPRSTSGGVHLGDVSSADSKATADGFTEMYVCPQGFDGRYRVTVKDIWGRPTGRKVSVKVYSHYGTDKQGVIDVTPALGEKSNVAALEFELKDGRRAEPLPEAQIAQVATVNAANRAVLAQQLAQGASSSVSQLFANSLAAGNGLGFFRRGAVGYRPVLSTLPEGANFSGNAVISADRRYVRVSPSPLFSQVTDVSTFNFVTGSSTSQAQTGGGGFGGAGIGGGT